MTIGSLARSEVEISSVGLLKIPSRCGMLCSKLSAKFTELVRLLERVNFAKDIAE